MLKYTLGLFLMMPGSFLILTSLIVKLSDVLDVGPAGPYLIVFVLLIVGATLAYKSKK